MQRRLLSVIIFAVLAATVSSTILYKIISGAASRTTSGKTAPVFVAARELNAGALIADADVQEVTWPVTGDSPWLGKRSDVIGRALLTPLAKGEPVAESRLAAKGIGAGIASRIPPGKRAVAVRVDELTGLSKFILPGMHVDVISTGGAGKEGMVARTILQNIEVFSTNQSLMTAGGGELMKEKSSGPPVFNLLVTPSQAELLSQAVAQSRIELVLRNPLDTTNAIAEVVPPRSPAPVKVAKARMAPPRRIAREPVKVAVLAPPPTPNPAPAPPPTVEIIQGTKRTVSRVVAAPPEPK